MNIFQNKGGLMKRIAFLFIFFSILLAACQPEPVVLPGDVLFSDDFSTHEQGWIHLVNDGGVMDYNAGGFRFYVREPNLNYWTTPGQNFSDVRIEVDALQYSGPQENRLGLICRYRDDLNYYFFVISTDGYYAIGKVKEGVQSLLGQDAMQYASAIETGVAINHLRAECQGSTLRLYINDSPIALVDDTDFLEGDVGMLAGTFDVGGLDVLFDDFQVLQP
jgi:hypothetical protein